MAKSWNIPDDCEFPQVREIADPEKMAAMLQRHLGPDFAAQGLLVESCKITQMNYRPGSGYKFSLQANIRCADRQSEEQTYFGVLFPAGRWRAWEMRGRTVDQNLAQPKFGPPLIHIPEWQLFLWAYPNDPNLPGLSLMVNLEKILALARATPEKFGLPASASPAAIEAEMTKYVPSQRCGYIYRIALANGAGSTHSVYGKAYKVGTVAKVYEITRQIWESEASQKREVLLPQPYSFDAGNSIVWQEAISGKPLAKIAETFDNLAEMAKEIGARLAAFHGTPLQLETQMTFDCQIEEVRQTVEMISRAFPDHAGRCKALGQRLLDVAARLGPGPLAPVHGSFKFSHIFVTAKGITFIDFDGANLGDPCNDLGRFIAHLYKMKAEFSIDPEVADQTISAFCASYNRAATSPIPPERISWFAASHLLASQAFKAVKRINPSALNKLLKMAERLCP